MGVSSSGGGGDDDAETTMTPGGRRAEPRKRIAQMRWFPLVRPLVDGGDSGGGDDDYTTSQKDRADEMAALGQAIGVLNDDDALDTFKKAVPSFTQVESRNGNS